MGKVDVYFGSYTSINEVTREESDLLGSNHCVIGMPLKIVYEAEGGLFRVTTEEGESLGLINPKDKLRIRGAIEDGWGAACWLSLVWYDNSDKLFHGEVVYQYYNVKPSQVTERANLDAYTRKTSERIAQGKRPDIALNGEGWDKVVETGDWEGSGQQSMPIDTKRDSGTVVLKRKRSLADKLVMDIIAGKPAVRWGVTIGFTAIVLLIILFVCKCTMGA